MQISSPDYSNLINATANNASADNRMAAQKASQAEAFGSTVFNVMKGTASLVADVISTQNEAQQASLKPELEKKSEYYTHLLNESIKNGTTYIDTDENGKMTVHYAPEVLEYKNTWLDDVNSRSELSASTRRWASKAMESVYNQSDEQVLYTIAANNASLASSDMDETVKQAAITAANSGDYSILENTIAGLNVSDQYKQAYTQWAKPIYESEYQTNHANELATTEGIDAAYKYINSLPIESSRKDTLKSGAYNEFQRSNSALLQSTDQSVAKMLEAGSSWSEIHKTLENVDGYSAYQRGLVKDEILKIQSAKVTETCAPYLAQVQSGMLSADELEDIKKDLKLNKGLFAGGLESQYETYMGIVDNAIQSRLQKDTQTGKAEDVSQYRLQADTYYDMWENKTVSGDDALTQIRSVSEANPTEMHPVNAMSAFVDKVVDEKVPLVYRDYFKTKLNSFSSLYATETAMLGYQPTDDDYVSNFETLYKNTVNFIQGSEDLTLDDIDTFMNQQADGFFARYADAKANSERYPTTAVPTTVYSTKDLKSSAEYYYNLFDGGRLSSVQALQNLSDLANAASGDPDALAEIEGYTAKINKQRVPTAWNAVYEDYIEDKGIFDTMYLRQMDVNSLDKLDDDQYVKYINDKSYFEGALADYISENPGLTTRSINAEAQRIMKTFSASYATKERDINEGVDKAETKSQGFIDILTEFSETVPFRYNYNAVTGNVEYEWITDTAQSNWDNAGRYGLQSLRAAGYDVSTFGMLEVGSEAFPVMVFYSSDGKSMYTINLDAPVSASDPQVGDVVNVEIVDSGNFRMVRTSETVSPSIDAEGNPSSPNFQAQQIKLQEEERDAERAKRYDRYVEERAESKADEYIAGKTEGVLTSAQLAYVSELEAEGLDYATAYEMAPKVDAEMQRLKRQGVQTDIWDTALRNLGIKK